MVLSAADRFGDAEAVVDGPLRLTFTELVGRIRCAAGAFDELGVAKGDRVAVWAPNSADWIIAAFGLLTAGGVLVPVNTRFKPGRSRRHHYPQCGEGRAGCAKDFLGQDYTAPAGVPVIDLASDFLSSGSPFERGVSGTDVSDVIFTSGTTGRPKGAMMNHRQTLRMYEEWATLADLREGDRYLMINPYFHTFGLKAGLIRTSFLRGATMLPLAVFDVDAVVDLIEARAYLDVAWTADVVPLVADGSRQGQAFVAAGGCHRCRRHSGRTGSPHPQRTALRDVDDGLRAHWRPAT